MIAFSHIRSTTNIGDLMCTPYYYFNFPDPQLFNLGSVLKGETVVPECDAIIFGGGAIEPFLRERGLHRMVPARKKIAWGIGTSRHGHEDHGRTVEDMDLVGVREVNRTGGKVEYVPCASCMHTLFDQRYDIQREVAMFINADPNIKRPTITGIPTLDNSASMTDVISWLGSAQTIITNSYHGTYWATLLGRQVLCLAFSSKFHGFKYPPTFLKEGQNWRQAAMTARMHPEALTDCRRVNKRFYEMVQNTLDRP